MKAMILAAGRGERLRPLTDTLPKPLIPVAGKPLLVHHLEKLAAAGFKEIVINHAWLGHLIEAQIGDGSNWGLSIQYSAEHQVSAYETGGGIKKALPWLTDGQQPFLVINGDIYLDNLPSIHDLQLPEGQWAKLFLTENPAHHPQGDFSLAHDDLLHSDTNASDSQNSYTFSGLGIYHPQLFVKTPEGAFGLGGLLRQAMAQQKVTGQLLSGYWCDVGTQERLNEVSAHIQAQV